MIEVLKIRDDPISLNDPRPLAVAIFPKTDHNGAFESYSYPTIERLMELGYRVVYYEAGYEHEAERYLSEVAGGGKRKADIIVLSGHGTSTTMALSGADFGLGGIMDNEKIYIDTSDFKSGDLDINLPKYLSPDGDLVLCSCSNGEGRDKNPDNLANTIARTLPKGVTVHSSDRPANIASIDRGDDGRIKVELTKDSLYVTNGQQ